MTEGDVLIAPLLQSDGRAKNPPVIVLRLMPSYGDLLVCGVSTQLQQEIDGFDEVIRTQDADYFQSGLKSSSLIRLGFLAVLPKSNFIGRIGSVSPERHLKLLRQLASYLTARING